MTLQRAIDAKLIEIDRLEHPEVGEALARILGEGGAGVTKRCLLLKRGHGLFVREHFKSCRS